MAGQVETDITLYTKTELQEIQNNSHSGSVNDSKGNVQSILSAIVTYTSTAAQANRDYVDILWSSIKTGNYTDKILGWIGLSAKNSLDEHKFGIADSIWNINIANRIAESGCSWIFIYERDSEQPCGLRISWKDVGEGDTDPIEEAWQNNQYIILPQNKYVFPTSTEVKTVVVQPNHIQVSKDFVRNIFSTINNNIQSAAKNGNNNVQIPWASLGNFESVQKMFIALDTKASITEAESLSSICAKFMYGRQSGGYYEDAENRLFTIDDFNPMEMGFFNDATYTENEYVSFNPKNNFSLFEILTSVLGYGVSYYADIDYSNGKDYCKGMIITWNPENSYTSNISDANYLATINYNTVSDEYRNSLVPVLSWADDAVPELDDYVAANKKNNTEWLKAFIDLTASKMKTAFAKGDRSISILWSEISSAYANEVKRAWRNEYCQYNTSIQHVVTNGSNLDIDAQMSIQAAYNNLMNCAYYSQGYNADRTYTYGYIRYKKTKDETITRPTQGNIINVDYSDAIGIAVTLYGKVESSYESGNTADAQASAGISRVQEEWLAKEAPKA